VAVCEEYWAERENKMSQKLAIRGGKPVRKKPFTKWPIHGKEEEQLLNRVLRSGDWSFNGPMEMEFAEKFSRYHDAKYGICAVNGTATLEVALRAVGISPGDEVIVPALTWVATATTALVVNAVPVFVDVLPDTYCIDPHAVEAAITKRTRAIMPVHLYRCMADMDSIVAIARKHGLAVIEDCAHAHGSKWRGKGAGSLGDIGSFSFQQSKLMTSGEGGIMLTNGRKLFERCFSYKHIGYIFDEKSAAPRKVMPPKDETVLAWNYRITEFQAAMLLAQLKRLPGQVEIRRRNEQYLSKELAKIPGIRPLKQDSRQTTVSGYAYVFRYDENEFNGVPVEVFRKALFAEGMPCSNIYVPVHKSPFFTVDPRSSPFAAGYYNKKRDYRKMSFPVSEKASYREAVAFLHQVLLGTKDDMDDIIQSVAKIYDNRDRLKI
jgi:L-glutamine:2-deoxy-scyllo-inosose/3-amino-2,3-dideoxy-scyllo-inosose aminotransferase